MTTPQLIPTASSKHHGLVAAAVVLLLVSSPSVRAQQPDVAPTRPHVLRNQLADVIVRIRGGANCTGTPITGTKFVVTAAHCVLNSDGGVVRHRQVLRDGVAYTPVAVIVNPEYHRSPGPLLDAAVLMMDRILPGPSATIAATFPTEGLVTLAGFQPLDTDGSLLRGTRYDNVPLPRGAAGGLLNVDPAVAGCVYPASTVQVAGDQVKLPCGLIPGASGGGLFAEQNGETMLVGIISTVAADLSYNGLVPLAALHDLLADTVRYTFPMTA